MKKKKKSMQGGAVNHLSRGAVAEGVKHVELGSGSDWAGAEGKKELILNWGKSALKCCKAANHGWHFPMHPYLQVAPLDFLLMHPLWTQLCHLASDMVAIPASCGSELHELIIY